MRYSIAIAIIVLLSSGCDNSAAPPHRDSVIFWHFWGGRDRPIVEEIVSRFNASQDRYWVRAVAMPGNNLDLKFFLSVAGGDPPDLVNQDDPIVADWAYRGALVPIDELATPQEYEQLQEWLFPSAQRLASFGGRLYAVPNGLDIRALYCNTTLLTEFGLTPPRTLDELDRLAEIVAPPDASTELERVGYLPDPRRLWAWGVVFGGQFWDSTAVDPAEVITADHPKILQALDWMAGYSQRYGASRVTAFRSGDQALSGAAFPLLARRRYAVIMDGQWRLRDIADARAASLVRGENPDTIRVVPLPPPEGGLENAGWVNGNFFVVPRGARQPAGAWQFMKFWSGFGGNEPEAARACAEGGWIPVSQHVVQQPAFQRALTEIPLLKVFVELASSKNQRPTPALPIAPFYYREVVAAAQDVMYRDADPSVRLGQAALRARQQLAATLGQSYDVESRRAAL